MVAIVCSVIVEHRSTERYSMNYVLNTLPNCQGEFCTNVAAYFVFGVLVMWHENPILVEIA